MKKNIFFLLLIILVFISSCGLDLSTKTKYISVYNKSNSILLINMEPFQSANDYKRISYDRYTAWVYESEENCILHILVYLGDVVFVDGEIMLDTNKISSVGDYQFTTGENATDIVVNEDFDVEIKSY